MKPNILLETVSLEKQSMRRLLTMRNLLITGEITAVIIFSWWQSSAPNLTALIVLWVTMAVWNYFSYSKLRKESSLTYKDSLVQLFFDILAFTVFLYLTGGATNPLGWYYLVPIMISATLLPKKHTLAIAIICIVFYLLLLKFYIPLPDFGMDEHSHHAGHDSGSAFSLHILGMWFGFLMSALLVAWYITDLAHLLREKDHNLALASEQALKDEQLVAMATLATGAAHELGTPLGTMLLVTESLAEDYPEKDFSDIQQSTKILQEQIALCKEALSLITVSVGETSLEGGSVRPAGPFLDEIISRWQDERKVDTVNYTPQAGKIERRVLADRTVVQAIHNILNNAGDASPEFVEIQVLEEASRMVVRVYDKGEGFPDDFCHKLGDELVSSKEHGLGIGLLLAYATIRRIGGEINCFNDEKNEKTCTEIILPFVDTLAT